VSPEGNMTLMTTAQVGDWDHDTTGEPKDLFVTGDVHIGKTNGSLFVNGDIDVRPLDRLVLLPGYSCCGAAASDTDTDGCAAWQHPLRWLCSL
jgi:hypothetical protein